MELALAPYFYAKTPTCPRCGISVKDNGVDIFRCYRCSQLLQWDRKKEVNQYAGRKSYT